LHPGAVWFSFFPRCWVELLRIENCRSHFQVAPDIRIILGEHRLAVAIDFRSGCNSGSAKRTIGGEGDVIALCRRVLRKSDLEQK
jgi:hypothetical protein